MKRSFSVGFKKLSNLRNLLMRHNKKTIFLHIKHSPFTHAEERDANDEFTVDDSSPDAAVAHQWTFLVGILRDGIILIICFQVNDL